MVHGRHHRGHRSDARTTRPAPPIQLVDAANAAGGEDNITVVVVAVTDEAPVPCGRGTHRTPGLTGHGRRSRQPAGRGRRRRGVRGVGRILLWALPIVIVLGVAVGAVGWYAWRSYYVGLDQGQVTVFKGVPGGLAGWNPTVERRTTLGHAHLRPADLAAVKDNKTFSSRSDADAFVGAHPRAHHHDHDHDDDHVHHHDDDDHHHDDRAGLRRPPRRRRPRRPRREITHRVRRRRSRELGLGLLAVVVTGAGYVLLLLADRPDIPADLWVFLLAVLGLYVVAHLALRRFAPRADPTLLPIVFLLNGIGYFTISRLDRDLARVQAIWTAVGIGAFVLTLIVVRHVRTLERYKYTFLLLGVGALLLPSFPGIGREINGARLWVRVGPVNFQPGEAAKVLLVVFFAAYLVDKRELLAAGTRHIGRVRLPDPKHLGPLLLAWGFSILVMVRQKDLGSSLLFFAVFAAMLYIATERWSYLVVALGLFLAGAYMAYHLFGHVQDRVSSWIDPWSHSQTTGFQLVQSLFALGSGGFAGTGLGLGSPQKIKHRLKVSKDGFEVFSEEFEIESGRKKSITAKLEPQTIESPAIKTGELDRKVAKSLLSAGAEFDIQAGADPPQRIKKGVQLPKSPFAITSITLESSELVGDDFLESLSGLQELSSLTLSKTRRAPAGISNLRRSPKLKTLWLWGIPRTDAFLEEVVRLPKLTSLTLTQGDPSDEGIAKLLAITQLEEFSFAYLPVTDGVIDTVTRMKNLRKLNFIATNVNDERLEKVALMKNLEELSISWAPISAEGVNSLLQGNLIRLSLANCNIEDGDLNVLHSLGSAICVLCSFTNRQLRTRA